jgi:hypothetical protein
LAEHRAGQDKHLSRQLTHELCCHVISSLNIVAILKSNIATKLQIKNKLLVCITEAKTTVTKDTLQRTGQQVECIPGYI